MSENPLRVLVAGGGVAALESVLALRSLAGDRVALELLAPGADFAHRPYSVRSPFTGEPAPQITFDRTDVIHHRGALAEVDSGRHEVRTTDGGRLPYDRLIVAVGAQPVDGVPGATLFRGPVSAGAVEGALERAGDRVIFTAPAKSTWSLPVYELALLAAHERPDGPELLVVTAEPRPLDLFGRTASDAVARLLVRAGVGFVGGGAPTEVVDDALLLHDGRLIAADTVIALPRLRGRTIAGLPADDDGFIPIDEHARIPGVLDVYAAGDIIAGPVKQGGLAAQQADAAAEAIAAEAGAPVEPRPYRPVLRGLLLTGDAPLYMRKSLEDKDVLARPVRSFAPDRTSRSPLWWPSEKIVGRYITGYLAGGRA